MKELTIGEIEAVSGGFSDQLDSFLWGVALTLAIIAVF